MQFNTYGVYYPVRVGPRLKNTDVVDFLILTLSKYFKFNIVQGVQVILKIVQYTSKYLK